MFGSAAIASDEKVCYVSAPNLMPPEEIVIGRHLDSDFGVLELIESRSRCPRGLRWKEALLIA
jgi:hypothetical protein